MSAFFPISRRFSLRLVDLSVSLSLSLPFRVRIFSLPCLSISISMRSTPVRRALSSPARASSSSSSRAPLPAAPRARQSSAAAARSKSVRATAAALPSSSSSSSPTWTSSADPKSIPALKAQLLSSLVGTGRGGSASASARGAVEEAVLALEAAFALADEGKEDEDFESKGVSLLPGRWRLIYTTALDVAPLLAASEAAGSLGAATASPFFPEGLQFPRVGALYQEFDALPSSSTSDSSSSPSFAPVRNIITFHLPPLLDSLTATVSARYEARARRRLRLVFDRAALGEARISPAAEALLAPALLPRGTLQKNLLMFLRSAEVGVPLSAQGFSEDATSSRLTALLKPLLKPAREFVDRVIGTARDAAGGEYFLSFLDEENLIGRQTAGGGGVFIFVRDDVGGGGGGGEEE